MAAEFIAPISFWGPRSGLEGTTGKIRTSSVQHLGEKKFIAGSPPQFAGSRAFLYEIQTRRTELTKQILEYKAESVR